MNRLKSKRIFTLAKIIISLSLLFVLFTKTDVYELFLRFQSINVFWLLVVLILPHFNIMLSSIKWKWLLKAVNVESSLIYLFRIYLIGTFFSNFMPSVIGGDLTRVFIVNNRVRDASGVIAATFMERLMGFGALVLFVILILLQPAFDEVFGYAVEVAVLLFLLTITILSIVIWGKASKLERFAAGSGPLRKLVRLIEDVQDKVHRFRSRSDVLIRSYLISLLFYIISMLTVWAAAFSIGVKVSFATVMSIVPLVLSIGLLPVSVGGLGINEGSYVFLFTLFGVSAVDAFSIALLLRGRIILTGIAGALVFARFRQPVSQ